MLPGHRGKNRDYKGENATYKGTPEQIKLRASRNKARAEVEKRIGRKLPTGMEVDHKDANPLDNNPKNLRVMTQKANDSKGHKKA